MKKLLSDPKFYADVLLFGVVVALIIVASGKSVPQLGREAWAAVASITGQGTQSALAQFTGTNTIGNATVAVQEGVSNGAERNLGHHAACFLTYVRFNTDGGGGDERCHVLRYGDGSWGIRSFRDSSGDQTTCEATCIN